MTSNAISRWTSAAFVLGGVCLALWPTTHPWGRIDGPEVASTARWVVSHSFHFAAAILLGFGLAGLAAQRLRAAGRLETISLAVLGAGVGLYAGTGAVTAHIWPVLARRAPDLVRADGPFLHPPHPLLAAQTVILSLGLVLTAVALRRARVLSAPAAAVLGLGALLLMSPIPPLGPAPWVLFPAGGVLTGAGLVALGLALRPRAQPADERAAATGPALA